VVVEGVHQGDEPASLSLLVQREERNVPDEDGVKESGHLQVVARSQGLGLQDEYAGHSRNTL